MGSPPLAADTPLTVLGSNIVNNINASLRKTAAVPSARRLVHRPGTDGKSGRFLPGFRSFPSLPELPD